jgi:hypothetical protein
MPLMRLTYSGTDIDFYSDIGSTISDHLDFVAHTSKNGTLWTMKRAEVPQWEPKLRLDETDADNINDWTKERYTCTFCPDQEGAPGTTHQVKILNTKLPMQRVADGGPVYDGQLILRKTTA